jgi:hypothetical protein
VVVVASSRGIRSTIRLTARLDPDESIGESVTSVGGRSESKTSTLGVTPISLSLLASRLLTRSTLVDDELDTSPALLREKRSEGVNVSLLIVVGVALGVVRLGGKLPAVVVGDVGDETANARRLAGVLVDLSVELSSRANVGGPAEPATVTSIEVHGDVGKVEFLDGVDGEFLVSTLGLGALVDVQVGDQVSKGVRLCNRINKCNVKSDALHTNNKDDLGVGVVLENALDLGNVGLVLVGTILVEGVLSVRGSSSAVTVGKIVDNELAGILATSLVSLTDISKGILHERNVVVGVPELCQYARPY